MGRRNSKIRAPISTYQMTDEDRRIIICYRKKNGRGWSAPINVILRDSTCEKEEIEAILARFDCEDLKSAKSFVDAVNALDVAHEHSWLIFEAMLFRGVNMASVAKYLGEKLEEGAAFHDLGYMSTTFDRQYALDKYSVTEPEQNTKRYIIFDQVPEYIDVRHLFVLYTPTGQPALFSDEEDEYILERGLGFVVLGIHDGIDTSGCVVRVYEMQAIDTYKPEVQ